MKIYIKDCDEDTFTPLLGSTRSHDILFHLERNHWTFVKSIKEADIIPLMNAPFHHHGQTVTLEDQVKYVGALRNDQYILMLFFTHSHEKFNAETKTEYLKKWETVTSNILSIDINPINVNNDYRHVYNPFVFNLIKALFTDYHNHDFNIGRMWFGRTSAESFVLQDITQFNPVKRFLIPNIIRHLPEFKDVARRVIKEKIIQEDDCFYSDHENDKFLDAQETSEYFRTHYNPRGSGIVPMKNSYYTESIVSVFAETIGTEKYGVKALTEKTFIPLIKGHFIMPFGYKGIVKDIQQWGFKLPEWIDYSYDLIDNDNERLDRFVSCVHKLRDVPLDVLTTLANNDINLIKYNRELFYTKPYIPAISHIKNSIRIHKRMQKR